MADNTSDQGQAGPAPRIGGYELLEKIGRGAVGVVYKARQVSIDRIVALKVLDPKYARNEKYVERFLREGRSAARLGHVNIVRGIDAGISPEGYYYFAMEYVGGVTVKQLLKRAGVLPEARAVDIATQMARALEHASGVGLIHRDIKPENIIVTKEHVAKLADLGLAKSVVEDVSVTVVGQAMGTPMYVSPEQAKGLDSVDMRADIYSLGATLYHMATGSAPFDGENPTVIMLKHINEEPPPPRELNPDLSEGLCHVLAKMLAKEPDERYQSAAGLISDLEAVAAGLPVEIARTKKTAPLRAAFASRFARLLVIGVAALGASAWISFTLLYSPRQEPTVQPKPKTQEAIQLEVSKADFKAARKDEDEGNFDKAKERYEEVRQHSPDEDLKNRAAQRIAEIEEIEKKQADSAAFEKLKGEVDDATGQGAYPEAIQRVEDFDPASRHEEIAGKAEELLRNLRKELRELELQAEQQWDDAKALLAEEKLDEAKREFGKLSDLGYPDRAKEGIAEVDRALERKEAEAARETHEEFWLEFAWHLRENSPDDARDLAIAVQDKPELGDSKNEVEWDVLLISHLQRIEDDARKGLKALDGKKVVPFRSGEPVLIVDVTDEQFVIVLSDVRMPPYKFSELSNDERFRFAGHYWKENNTGALSRVAYHLFITFDLVAAGGALEGLPPEDAARSRTRIDLLIPEREAATLLAQAVEAEGNEEWKSARHACEQLGEEYAATLTVRQNWETIGELKKKAGIRVLAGELSEKLKARVEVLDDERWRLTWDFSANGQLAGFTRGQVPEDLRERVKGPKIEKGVVELKSIDIVAPDIFAGTPVEIQYKLRSLEKGDDFGWGRVLLKPSEPRKKAWEFSLWYQKGKPNSFRSFHTASKWKLEHRGPPAQRARCEVKIEVTADHAKAWSGKQQELVYDSGEVKKDNGEADPTAKPDLSGRYIIRFGSFPPEDKWAFDDIIITGDVRLAHVRGIVYSPEPDE